MATNKKWAKMVNGVPQYAKTVESIDGKWVANPTAAQYRKAGFKPYVDDGIPDEIIADGFHWEHYRWDDSGDNIIRIYHPVEDPAPPPRIFSKLKIVAALTKAGVWANVKQYIIDADLYDLYLAAQEFSEDNEYFVHGKTALQTALGWTDEQVEAILQEAAG